MGWVNSVDWVKVTQVILNVAQTLALVVGGFWVYFKFIRSRTFARRAALDVDGSFLSVEGRSLIRVEVVLRNTGLSKIPLRANRQVLTLWATSTSDFSSNTNLSWHFWMVSQVFTTDQSVESQEAIKDVALLPVASEGGPWLAFRIRVEAWAEPRWKWFGRVKWVTHTVLPAQVGNAVTSAP
ncbi:MAG: hypothetical protein ACYDHE_06535 [Candidatus Acidiferrales bacterium]